MNLVRDTALALADAGEDVVAAYVFGSVARGTAGSRSDVDVGVLYANGRPRTLETRFGLESELERRLGRCVEIVPLNDAPCDLVQRILADGVIVLDRDRAARIRFEVRARQEMFGLRARAPTLPPATTAMTDADLVAKKLALIETCVAELRLLARPELLATDIREERFVEHTLQIAIQASLDVAAHIVADDRLGEPRTNRDLFALLARAGWLDAELGDRLRRMVGFRNILVHGYEAVDVAVVKDIVENHLGDLLAFVSNVRGRFG